MFAKFATLCRSVAAVGLAAAALVPTASLEACGRRGYAGAGYYSQPSYAAPAPAYAATSVQVRTAAATAQQQTAQMVVRARQLLKARDFAAAQQAISVAVAREPNNSALLQLKSLISFAQGDFQRSAAEAYSALTLGRSIDWAAIQQLYPSTADYTEQYHRLGTLVKERPQEAHLQFLLAYHHLMLGHKTEGRVALEAAQTRLPQDKLIPILLSQLPAAPKTETTPAATTVAIDDLPPAE